MGTQSIRICQFSFYLVPPVRGGDSHARGGAPVTGDTRWSTHLRSKCWVLRWAVTVSNLAFQVPSSPPSRTRCHIRSRYVLCASHPSSRYLTLLSTTLCTSSHLAFTPQLVLACFYFAISVHRSPHSIARLLVTLALLFFSLFLLDQCSFARTRLRYEDR